MGGIAVLAKEMGHQVSGVDANVYPPMSDQLREQGIALAQGYTPDRLPESVDRVVVGNALSRGNALLEAVLDRRLPYTSGPQFLAEVVLPERWTIAVAGTHGKTTTTGMVAWILEHAGLHPGFLVGGVPRNFGVSARLGRAPFFVVEADEYDTAFFDKRSKFVHYRPQTLILNNLEFDHADIFPDLEAIKTQFHHLVRTVPGSGRIIMPVGDPALEEVIERGCWTPVEVFGEQGSAAERDGWSARWQAPDGSRFEVFWQGRSCGVVTWSCIGRHNVFNALAAVAAARHAGVAPEHAVAALCDFHNVKRRLEVRGAARGVTVYDDFAHHPTAIATTVDGLRRRVGQARIIAIVEPRSNTMKLGAHQGHLAASLAGADLVLCLDPGDLSWDVAEALRPLGDKVKIFGDVESIVAYFSPLAREGDHALVMSNGAFGDIHARLLAALES